MGQGHQTLIRYINKERNSANDTRVGTLYNQWCYRIMPILSLFKIAKFNKINTTDSERNYNSLTDDRNCYIDKIDTIIKLISADFNTGFLTNYFIFDKDEEFQPIGALCNNDGYLLIDLTKGNKIHYAFLSGKNNEKVIDGKKYFSDYIESYKNWENEKEIYEEVQTSLDFIKENCVLMSNEDINNFR